jgi:hypothetical protein
MMERWPEEHGSQYRAALRACTGRLTSKDDVEKARRAVLAAANEAGLVVKDEDEEADLEPHPDIETAPSSPSEQKRREIARMEEEEEFLVRFLARETGITEEQARELFHMIGDDRPALLREARILKARH